MENALKNLFAISDLRNRVLFTLALLGVYRIGSHVPTPGVNQEALRLFADQLAGSMFGLANMFTGGSLERVTIFALPSRKPGSPKRPSPRAMLLAPIACSSMR